jgi:quercetin dioxygenase-like cupin family protein
MQIDAEPFVREDLFGGKGAVKIWDLLRQSKIEPFVVALACELDPGGSVGPHVQQEFPEIVICTGGQGTATVNGQAHELVPGALVPLQHGQTLALENASSSEPLRYLIIKGRAL